ncbi:hypothetical protein HY972_02970 [Candidatus Kaiserbacteria bacterium]|nr:hypothetical protein [Candidatus Kaiserbacteria bacterium]
MMMEALRSSSIAFGGLVADAFSFALARTVANAEAVASGLASGGTEAVFALIPLGILLLQFASLFTTLKVLQMIWFLMHEVRFVWQRPKAYSAARPGGKRILIIGDSAAYGTGADRAEDTIAGRLGHDFPQTEIVNTAVNGSVVREATDQIRRAGPGNFDLIIICTGGNDILRYTGLRALEEDLTRLLQEAIRRAEHQIIVLFYANLGGAPIFPRLVRSLLSRRTHRVYEIFRRVTTKMNVPLVELYTGKEGLGFSPNPFLEEPAKYYSKDRMHPSSEGYRLWYNRMWGEMVAHHFTFAESNTLPIAAYTAASYGSPRA